VGDAHFHVIHDHAKVVGGESVRAEQDKILDLFVFDFDIAVYSIVIGSPALRNQESNGRRIAGGGATLRILFRDSPASPVIDPNGRIGLLIARRFIREAETAISSSLLELTAGE
jgi:hypothetical protein